MTLRAYLKQKMSAYKGRIAFAGTELTYGDLLEFGKQKSEKKKLVICEGKTREEQAIGIIRCIFEGDVAVPVSAEYGAKNYGYIRQKISEENKEDITDLAFLMFTSGTTGVPKGVMLTDENIIANLEYISGYFDLSRCRKICIARPLVHIAVLTGELLYALCNGLTVYFYVEPFMPKRLMSFLVKNKIDVFCATPTLYSALARSNVNHACPIKVGAISGEVLSESAGRIISDTFPHARFYNVYGLTEHSPRVSALLPDEFKARPNSIGKPIGGVTAKIENGELLIQSRCVMKGYFRDELQTAAKLRDGWLHTGDMAHADADGYLYIDGRKDNMIIRSGINIYPEEIELAVKECSGIEDCVAYGENTERGVVVCLKYVGKMPSEELRRRLIGALNPVIVPNRIEQVERIERTASGKKVRK